MSSSLARNGYALIASSGLTAVLGALFWIIAARFYTEAQVGIGGALVSTLVTLSSAAQLNLGNVLNRFIPSAGAGAGRVIALSYAISLLAAVAVGLGFLVLVGRAVPSLGFLAATPWLGGWFVVAIGVWTIFALQDSALAGLQEAGWVPLENTVYSVAKIALLFAFAGMGTGLAIFAAWTAPLIALVAAVNWLIFARIAPARISRENAPITVRQLLGFLGWDNVGSLAMVAAMGIAPLLVLRVSGAAENAYYYLSWTIAYSLYLIGRSMSISLLAEVAAEPRLTRSLVADSLVHTALTLGGAAVAVFVAAPLIMSLFGQSYAAGGTAILRVLALASVPWGLVTLYVAVARAEGRLKSVAGVQVATLVVVVSLSWLMIEPLGGLGVALAWLASHTLVLAALLGATLLREGPAVVVDWLLSIASAAARLARSLRVGRGNPATLDQLEVETLAATGVPGAALWRPLLDLPSLSDGRTIYVGERQDADGSVPPPGARAVLKRASTEKGIRAAKLNHEWLGRLQDFGRQCGIQIPEVLGWREEEGSALLVESVIRGRDGRSFANDRSLWQASLKEAALAVRCLHQITASERVVDEAWLREWIDEPTDLLRSVRSTLLSAASREVALNALRLELRRFWTGTIVLTGLGHGDFSPDNILFSETNGGAGAPLAVKGIVDWSGARSNAPRDLDLCHLAITGRALRGRQEIGQVVVDLIRAPEWNGVEEAWLLDMGDLGLSAEGRMARRAIVSFTWLHHVTACLRKSDRYSNARFWIAANIDWVLRQFVPKGAV